MKQQNRNRKLGALQHPPIPYSVFFILSRPQAGGINILLIPFILVTLCFFGLAAMGISGYNGRQHYKNDTDTITASTVQKANVVLNAQKDKEFAEKAKYPFDTYTSSAETGNVIVKYPKTWSAYVQEQSQGSLPVNGYFYPSFVPYSEDSKNNFALRMKIIQQPFDSILQQYTPQIQNGTAIVKPYKPVNVPGIIGVQVDGTVQTQKQGTMIVLPVRDKTIELWTEANSFKADYTNIILQNFTFTP